MLGPAEDAVEQRLQVKRPLAGPPTDGRPKRLKVILKMSTQLENIVNAYKILSKIPSILSGRLDHSGTMITSKWSVRNIDKGKNTKFIYNYVLNDNLNVVYKSNFATDVSTELLSAISPQETFKAVIREEKDNKDSKKQYLDVWRANFLQHSIDLTALDLHGDVYADAEFGSLDWSLDETAIVYVAEKKLKKSEPYIKRKAVDATKLDGSGEAPPKKGEEFVYRQDWGEQLVGKHLSVIVHVRLQDESVTILEGFPDSWCPGQVHFSPDGSGVSGVAWETEPRRLGLIFCTNRPSYIFTLTLDGHLSKISSEGKSVRSPRYRSGGDLVWLQRDVGGPHHACHQLLIKKHDTKEISTVIPIVEQEMKIENGSFYGVYSLALPSRCFSADGQRILLSTPQQNEVRSYVADIDSGRLVDVSIKDVPGSTSILDVNNDIVLAVYSNMTTPSQLYVARLPAKGDERNISWTRVSDPIQLPPSVDSPTVHYLNLKHENSTDGVSTFTAIYVAPSADSKKLPLIVNPHGGPHSGFVNSYALEPIFFNTLGFATLHVNYRGSTGAGQASVYFLPKNVGNTDVKDCELATREALAKFPIDEKNVLLSGGSHGGFLVTHLSGQYPDLYRAVITRNPVIDVASMFNSSDIPDWCAVESGFEFTESGPTSEEQLVAMRRCSPLVHAHKVRAPTALMLGSGDKRVPHYQGLEYARRLKANGVPTRVYMYEDNHSLSSLPAEMDNLINSAAWFFEHLQ